MRPAKLVLGFVLCIVSATTVCDATASSLALDSLRWRSIGPYRGGRATAVAGNPSQPFTFYIGTAGGGIYKTTDAGTRWTNVSDGFLTTASVGALAVAPSDPDIVYAGMGENTARANTLHGGDGMYRSTDAGATWTHIGLEPTETISRIVVDPANPDRVYVAAQGALYARTLERGVYRTEDGGKTWQKTLYVCPTCGAADLALDSSHPGTLYAAIWDYQRHPWAIREFGPNAGIFKTTNGGNTWSRLSNGLPASMGKIGVAVSADPDRVYAIVQADTNSQSGLYRSDNAGQSWKLINSAVNLTRRAFYYTKVFADPKNANVVWVPNLSMYRSTDGGETFSVVKLPHGDQHELWINPTAPNFMAETNDGGATVSVDGGKTWSTLDNQPTGQFYRLALDDEYPYRIYSAQQDNTTIGILSRSADPTIGTHDWSPVGGSESSFIGLDPEHPSIVYSSDYLGVFDVFSRPLSAQRVRPAYGAFAWGSKFDEFTPWRFSLNAPMFVSRHDAKKIYLGSQKVLLTTDEGCSWREVSPDLTRAGVDPTWDRHLGTGATGDSNYGVLTALTESPLRPGILWSGSGDGVVAVSRDGGKQWFRQLLPGTANDARINAIDPSPFDPAVAYIAATRFQYDDQTPYLFKTQDFGRRWTRIDGGLPSTAYARVIRADTARKGLLYAGTETGVYVSLDDGANWQPLHSGLPVTPITDLAVHGDDLVASTSGRGIYILDDLSPLRTMPPHLESAFLFPPAEAYRTKFGDNRDHDDEEGGENPPYGAIIDFYLPTADAVAIELRDSSGNLVRRLATDGSPGSVIKTSAGLNRIVWDLRGQPSPPVPADVLDAAGIATITPKPAARYMEPGRYRVRLTTGGKMLSTPLIVKADPRWKDSAAAYRAQTQLLNALDADLDSLRTTMADLKSRAAPGLKDIGAFYIHYAYLENWVNTAEPDVTAAEAHLYSLLHAKWLTMKGRLNEGLTRTIRQPVNASTN